MTAALLVALFSATLPSQSTAQADWNRLGPAVADVYALAIAPGDAEVIYAGCAAGLLRSRNGGRTWHDVGDFGTQVYSVTVDPTDPRHVYAGTYDGLRRSADGGQTWTKVHDIGWLAVVDPRSPSTVYALWSSQISKSTDRGRTWTETNLGYNLWTLTIDPTNPQILFASSEGEHRVNDSEIFRTVNGGVSWEEITPVHIGLDLRILAIDARGHVYRSNGPYRPALFKSTDSGQSWTELLPGPGKFVRSLAIDPRNPRVLYAGTFSDGLYKSTDGGRRWRPLRQAAGSLKVRDVVVHPSRSGVVFAAVDGAGLLVSASGGNSWIERPPPGTYKPPAILALTRHPWRPGVVFAGTNYGVFRSRNGGRRWRHVGTGLPAERVISVAVDPVRASNVYAGTSGDGVYKSTDGGETWRASNRGLDDLLSPFVRTVAIDAAGHAIFLATSTALYRSVDGARSWRKVVPETSFDVVVDPLDTDVVYAASTLGVHRSVNGGRTWKLNRRVGTYVRRLAIDQHQPEILVAITDHGFYRSFDGSESWERASTPHEMYVVHFDGSTLYGADAPGQISRSTDVGKTWSQLQPQLPNALSREYVLFSLATAWPEDGILYAGTKHGVFVLSDEPLDSQRK